MNTLEKINATIIKLRMPPDDASGPQLGVATMVQALSRPKVQAWLKAQHAAGELDGYIVALGTWLLSHAGDEREMPVVVMVPRGRPLNGGAAMMRIEAAKEAMKLTPDLPEMMDDDEEEEAAAAAPPAPDEAAAETPAT